MKNNWITCDVVWSNNVYYDAEYNYELLKPDEILSEDYLKSLNNWQINKQKYIDGYIFNNGGGFRQTSLCKPGVIIKLENGKTLLIGDINENGGICDDCVGIMI